MAARSLVTATAVASPPAPAPDDRRCRRRRTAADHRRVLRPTVMRANIEPRATAVGATRRPSASSRGDREVGVGQLPDRAPPRRRAVVEIATPAMPGWPIASRSRPGSTRRPRREAPTGSPASPRRPKPSRSVSDAIRLRAYRLAARVGDRFAPARSQSPPCAEHRVRRAVQDRHDPRDAARRPRPSSERAHWSALAPPTRRFEPQLAGSPGARHERPERPARARATSCLLAVTTDLPASSAARGPARRRLQAADSPRRPPPSGCAARRRCDRRPRRHCGAPAGSRSPASRERGDRPRCASARRPRNGVRTGQPPGDRRPDHANRETDTTA